MDKLEQIPYSIASGVDNMAQDVAMLLHGSAEGVALCRLYGWNEPALTFGYSQRWADIEASTSGFHGVKIRRTSGGGIVDHCNDLTYAISLPASHPFHRAHAGSVYEGLHQLIANILKEMEFNSDLAPCKKLCGKGIQPGISICFEAPEPFDVIDSIHGRKQAGAAMKRTRSGLLIQGSLSLESLPGLDREKFEIVFGTSLEGWLILKRETGKPLPCSLILEERDRFSSSKWNRRR